MNATAQLTYPQWLNTLDNLVLSTAGISLYDLPDLPFAPAFERDLTPEEFFDTVVIDSIERGQAR